MNSALTPLNDIPFPAVTICNMNQAKKHIADTINLMTQQSSMLLDSVCNLDNPRKDNETLSDLPSKWSEVRNFLISSSQPCTEMLQYCRFASVVEPNCMDIFSSTLTDEGLCCTFNQLNSSFMLKYDK